MLKTIMNFEIFHLWSALSMLIFFSFLVGVWFWMYRPGSTKFYKEMQKLPLD